LSDNECSRSFLADRQTRRGKNRSIKMFWGLWRAFTKFVGWSPIDSVLVAAILKDDKRLSDKKTQLFRSILDRQIDGLGRGRLGNCYAVLGFFH
jgi:hypothetical protein